MLEAAAELTDSWDSRAGRETVDVSADTTRVTLETIGRCAAGYSFGCFRTNAMHPVVEHMVEGLKASDHLGVLRNTYLPRFFARRAERKLRHHAAQMHGIADEMCSASMSAAAAGAGEIALVRRHTRQAAASGCPEWRSVSGMPRRGLPGQRRA